MNLIDLEQGTPEWLKWRLSGLGSSDMAAIMGKSPWSTALDVYNSKRGLSKDKPVNHAMIKGLQYEPYVRDRFETEMGRSYPPVCMQRSYEQYCLASLDGYCENTNTFLEIKVPGIKVMKLASEGKLPDHYMIQMQWQFFVSGCTKAYYVCYSPDSEEYYQLEVLPDASMMQELLDAASVFWCYNIDCCIPPEKKSTDCTEIYDESFKNWADAYKKCKETLDYNKIMLQELRDVLLNFAPDQGSFKCEGIKISPCGPRSTYDYEMMKNDGIDLEKYRKMVNPTEKNYVIRITDSASDSVL